jgi:hypothetical protein
MTKLVYIREAGQEDGARNIHISQRLTLLVNGYTNTYVVRKFFKNGSISFNMASSLDFIIKFEPNSDGKVFLPLM